MGAQERFAALVETMVGRGFATHGPSGHDGPRRAFGATSLKTGGRIFAMLVEGRLVVKLPAPRVDELIAAGAGERFDPGHGRLMKEWLALRADSDDAWLSLATESEAFVARRRRES